jgi:curli biogenesis system outer membrane secretion channel CsgG
LTGLFLYCKIKKIDRIPAIMPNRQLYYAFKSLICGVLIMTCCGCFGFFSRSRRETARNNVLPSTYSGLKARIAVADFEIQTEKANALIGAALKQMLINTLADSNRFLIIDSLTAKEDMPALNQQQKTRLKNFEVIIMPVLLEFEPKASGGSGGIGGGGGISNGFLGGLLGIDLSRARITVEIRVIETANFKVLASSKIQGQACDVSGNLVIGVLDTALADYASTPMEKSTRLCINETARYIAKTIPEGFYRY